MYKAEEKDDVEIWGKILPGQNPGEPDVIIGEDDYITGEVVTIEFDIEIEARSWGIKSIVPTVSKVFLNCIIERWADDSYDDYQRDLSDFTLQSESGENHGCSVSSVEINFEKKLVTVTF